MSSASHTPTTVEHSRSPLTDKARELLPALDEQSDAMEDEVTSTLTPGERAALLDMLQRVSASLGLSPGVHPGLGESTPLNSPT